MWYIVWALWRVRAWNNGVLFIIPSTAEPRWQWFIFFFQEQMTHPSATREWSSGASCFELGPRTQWANSEALESVGTCWNQRICKWGSADLLHPEWWPSTTTISALSLRGAESTKDSYNMLYPSPYITTHHPSIDSAYFLLWIGPASCKTSHKTRESVLPGESGGAFDAELKMYRAMGSSFVPLNMQRCVGMWWDVMGNGMPSKSCLQELPWEHQCCGQAVHMASQILRQRHDAASLSKRTPQNGLGTVDCWHVDTVPLWIYISGALATVLYSYLYSCIPLFTLIYSY